jgi:uncharacterized SAM-binding protein YcdF (DUF218 family)
MRYLFSQIIGLLTSPLLVTLILLLIAILLHWRGRRRASLSIALAGVALLYLCASGPVASALMKPLESSYRGIDDASLPQGIAGIAVLGSTYVPERGRPITGALPGESLARVAEGVRLAKRYGNVRLMLSGGVSSGYGLTASARGYEIFARDMGIDPASVVVLDQSQNTGEEVRTLAKLFGKETFLLVTSAYHMKRAMLLFEHYPDAHPIPAPTSQHIPQESLLGGLEPRTSNLAATHRAIHEYIGILAISAGQG